MVLCRFFQHGNCRFGSKCHNEHFDLKQIIKTDVDAAINGKQWPFSCYGPFKDKPCISNFIEDKSFEEVRYLCYEARKQNYFEQFHQQFTKEAIESTNKIKMFMHIPAMIDALANLYDAPDPTKIGINNQNPFLVINNVNVKNNNESLFSKPQALVGGHLFGSSINSFSDHFNGSSIFGGSSTSTSVFGQTPLSQHAPEQHQNSVFAQQSQSPFLGGVNIFAQSTQLEVSKSTGNLFSQLQQQHNAEIAHPEFDIFTQTVSQESHTSGFMQQSQQPMQFGITQYQPNMIDFSAYSKIKDLSPEDIEAFKSAEFKLGKIPFHPPPYELIKL